MGPGCCTDLTLTAALRAADGACWRSVARLVLPGSEGKRLLGGPSPLGVLPAVLAAGVNSVLCSPGRPSAQARRRCTGAILSGSCLFGL